MDEVARIREKTDIVGLISEYIPLKKMGRNFKALCPFHSEKTPSFVVSPERQIWHCFGCSKGGDCFTFLMEYENLEFIEALRTLAKKTGILLKTSNFQKGVSSKKEKIYELNKIALDFYHFVLTKHIVGKPALSYLLKIRKLDPRLIETFKLGFSPRTGNALSSYLINKKKYKREDLLEAGLVFEKDNGIFDFFKGRIMFPLFDQRGNVAGFSARILGEQTNFEGEGGKYINTRETLVYHKGSLFFGLNLAKDEIKKKDSAIITEGEFDVISMFSEGFRNVLAVKGTALTENQATLLSRFTKNVILCFDQDSAGYEATKRSLPVLEKKGLVIKAIVPTNAKDVDEAIKKDPFLFKKTVKNEIPVYDYIFSRLSFSFDTKTIDGKRQISSEFLPLIVGIENAIVKEHYLKRLSQELDSSYESVVLEMEKLEKKEKGKEELEFAKKDKKTRREILEEYLLALLVQAGSPKTIILKIAEILQNYQFKIASYKKILDALFAYFQKQEIFDSKNFVNLLPQELLKAFDTCFLLPLPKFEKIKDYEKETEKVASELQVLFLREKIKNLGDKVKTKEEEEELSRLIRLLREPLGVIK